ncbi:MAG TPA: hypothetical protein VE591_03275 [Candidatus Acidoferrum sp.]|jgi:hypothetical protein|nr:hypothetical protein [Candidatus Acidoferrum sp.]
MLVTIVVDGDVVPGAPPARLVDGRVLAPVAFVARLADRVTVAEDGALTAQRGERACAVRTVEADGVRLVVLAPLAACLGAVVSWDGASKTLGLAFEIPQPAGTHPPFDPSAPQVAPTAIFTPQPAPPTPRAIATGVPVPRRTGIPVTPSWPVTSPRP